MIHRGARTLSPQPVDESPQALQQSQDPGTIRAGAVCAQAGNPRGKVPSQFLAERRNAGGRRSPRPAASGGDSGCREQEAGQGWSLQPTASTPLPPLHSSHAACSRLGPSVLLWTPPPHPAPMTPMLNIPWQQPPPHGVSTHGRGALAGSGHRGIGGCRPARLGAREPQGQAVSGSRGESPFLELS